MIRLRSYLVRPAAVADRRRSEVDFVLPGRVQAERVFARHGPGAPAGVPTGRARNVCRLRAESPDKLGHPAGCQARLRASAFAPCSEAGDFSCADRAGVSGRLPGLGPNRMPATASRESAPLLLPWSQVALKWPSATVQDRQSLNGLAIESSRPQRADAHESA